MKRINVKNSLMLETMAYKYCSFNFLSQMLRGLWFHGSCDDEDERKTIEIFSKLQAIISGTSNQQAEFIEEVCKVTSKQAEMDILTLAMNKHGHEVVLAMLNGTKHKHIHNILKASILCKQEELLENEYAARVFKEIKIEYHNKLSGNYPTAKCH